MADMFLLEIVTPYRLLISEEVEEMTAVGGEGEFGVLPGHASLMTTLKPGGMSYKQKGKSNHIAVSSGFAEVGPEKVTILVAGADRAEEIDLEQARRELAEAETRLGGLKEGDSDYGSAERGVEVATVSVEVAEKR
ncbi:MAG: F0F1 ATP synthase subunit epsilon [Deltaproteobacteria bacterium]|nr:F0F1 ATP synthase subunit epsilon [Deltaproteobacteria bacterium]